MPEISADRRRRLWGTCHRSVDSIRVITVFLFQV